MEGAVLLPRCSFVNKDAQSRVGCLAMWALRKAHVMLSTADYKELKSSVYYKGGTSLVIIKKSNH
jgi:hypothetical protein